MHKKTAKSHRLTNTWLAKEAGSSKMTVLQRQRAAASYNTEDSRAASRRPHSSSSGFWNPQGDQGSWSEDIEDIGSRKTLEQWDLIERTLHDEQDQLAPGPLFDECLQWRGLLPHLRIIGHCSFPIPNGDERSRTTSSKTSSVTSRKGENSSLNDKRDEFLSLEHDSFSKDPSFRSSSFQNQKQAKEQVLDYIVEFICKELVELGAEKDAEDMSDSFSKYLKISSAPTCIGKNPLNSNNFHYNVESADTTAKANQIKETKKEKESDLDQNSQSGRNKMGTVFNERIIVSPEPFVSTSRESFSTLRRTPIQFLGESYEFTNNIHSASRRENTRRKLSLTRKTPLIATPHAQTSWNTPVCPTIWPKNIKLTPIDTSRLSSSKRRPSKTAESIYPRRRRNSLSPISRSAQPTSPSNDFYNSNCMADLEIRGSHIVVQECKRTIARRKLARIKHDEGQT